MPDQCSRIGCVEDACHRLPMWVEETTGYRGHFWIWLCERHLQEYLKFGSDRRLAAERRSAGALSPIES